VPRKKENEEASIGPQRGKRRWRCSGRRNKLRKEWWDAEKRRKDIGRIGGEQLEKEGKNIKSWRKIDLSNLTCVEIPKNPGLGRNELIEEGELEE
jgi:hypothetical protein